MTQLLLMLSCSAALVAGMATTSAPAQPGQDASLQEVWDWISSVAESQDQGKLNINMWMSGNKMSMQDTFFSMLVGEEAASSRMAGQTAEQEEDGLVSGTWSPGQAGGTINMYM